MSFASLVGGKLQSWKQFVLLLLLIVFLFFYCFSTHGNVEPLSQSDGDVASAVINENTEEDLNISQIDKTAASEKGADDNGNQETTIADGSNGDQQVAGSKSTPKPKYRKRQALDSSMSEIVNIMKDNSRMRAQSLQLSEGPKPIETKPKCFF